MKKYIFVINAIELLARIKDGKRVEGVLFLDKNTGNITFKAYNRKSKKRWRDILLHRLEHGWVKESPKRIKVYESIPKDLGLARVAAILDRETEVVHDALIEHELDMIEFC